MIHFCTERAGMYRANASMVGVRSLAGRVWSEIFPHISPRKRCTLQVLSALGDLSSRGRPIATFPPNFFNKGTAE